MAFNVTLNISYSSSCPQPHSTDIGATCQLIAYSIILIVSIFGNSILIGAISSNNARTQSVMNYYIFNMAAADLLATVFDMGIQICHYALMVMNRPFEWLDGLTGVFLCKFIVFIQGAAIACSVFTLVAIAMNRFLAVVFPFRRSRNNRTVIIAISLIWMSSFAIASPMLYAMHVQNVDGILFCLENWGPLFDNSSSPGNYTLALFCLLFISPLAVIATFYLIIVLKVWLRSVPGHVTAPNQLHEIETRKKILKICITVVLVFALCWLPFYIYLILYFIVSQDRNSCGPPEYVAFLGLFFGHANSAVNPFIYIMYNSDYKKGIKRVLKRLRCSCRYNRVRMRTDRKTLQSFPSLRTFKELEMTTL